MLNHPGLAPGRYILEVTVTDQGGLTDTESVDVIAEGENLPPTLVITTPRNGSSHAVEEDVSFSATVTDEHGATSVMVRWYLDGATEPNHEGYADSTGVFGFDQALPLGSHTARVEAEDDLGQVSEATSSFAVTEGGGEGPTIEGVDLLPDPAYESSTLTCSPYGWTDPSGGDEGYGYAWTVNDADLAGVATQTLDGDSFDKGDSVRCRATPDNGRTTGSPVTSGAVVISNSVPTDPVVNISPSPAGAGADLACGVTPSLDPDPADNRHLLLPLDPGRRLPRPRVDRRDHRRGQQSPAWASEHTAIGDLLACRVRACDPEDCSEWSEDTVEIDDSDNTAPTIDYVVLSPDPAYQDSTLTCAPYGWADEDGDPEGYTFAWLNDGTPVPGEGGRQPGRGVLRPGRHHPLHRHPLRRPRQRPAPVFSQQVEILNSAPGTPTVSISPDPAFRDNDLECVVSAPAPDPDPADTVEYRFEWLLDGEHDPFWDDYETIPAGNTTAGDVWTCRVTATDGVEDSAPASASAAGPHAYAGDLVITEINLNPRAVADSVGEWFEITNTADESLRLRNLEISRRGRRAPPGARGQPARHRPRRVPGARHQRRPRGQRAASRWAIATPATCAWTTPATELVLSLLGVEIDYVALDGSFGMVEGRSLALAPGMIDATDNDSSSAWCPSTSPLLVPPATSDFATPGEANDDCACWDSDGDGDGWGTHGSCFVADCLDSDPTVNPTASEICENGIDDGLRRRGPAVRLPRLRPRRRRLRHRGRLHRARLQRAQRRHPPGRSGGLRRPRQTTATAAPTPSAAPAASTPGRTSTATATATAPPSPAAAATPPPGSTTTTTATTTTTTPTPPSPSTSWRTSSYGSPRSWDWNCDGTTTRRWTFVVGSCSVSVDDENVCQPSTGSTAALAGQRSLLRQQRHLGAVRALLHAHRRLALGVVLRLGRRQQPHARSRSATERAVDPGGPFPLACAPGGGA